MKNVKVIFNDTDYELVKKACQQYDKLVKDYHEKDSLFGLFTLITIPSGFLIFAFAECISNASFANRIIMACTIILERKSAGVISCCFFIQKTISKNKNYHTLIRQKKVCKYHI